MKLNRFTFVCAAAGLLFAAGCSSDEGGGEATGGAGGSGGSGGASTEKVQVELFSWWIAPGEAEALQALVDLHKASHPNERIFNAAAESGDEARELLRTRLAENEPPDLFQANAHDMRATLEATPDAIEPLDDLFEQNGLLDVVVPEVLEDVTINGHIYSVPVNLHRENSLFYNKEIFAEQGLEPPTTLDEFWEVCEALKEAGITPVATSYQGWIQRIMFNSLAMGTMGPEAFQKYWSGEEPMDMTALGESVDALDRVLSDYSNASAGEEGFGWTNAADLVFDGEAAMFLHGDWAKGYFVQLGWEPDVDFGVVGAPGASDVFWYGVDVFALPAGAPHPEAARHFLETVASEDGQIAFNRIKGSSPVRLDVDSSKLDAMGQKVLADLQDAKVRMLVRNRDQWDVGLGEFAVARDRAALLGVYQDHPPGE